MTNVNYINVSLELWGCFVSIFVAICIFLSKYHRTNINKLYFIMLMLNTSALFFDALAFFFRGNIGTLAYFGVRFSNMIAFFSNTLLIGVFAKYLSEFLAKRTKISYKPLYIIYAICAILCGLILATQFAPIIYSIDKANIYHRESLFWVSHAGGIVALSICAGMLIYYNKFIRSEEKIAFWSYILLPILALILQIFFYGIVFLGITNTLSLIIIFLFLQTEQGRVLAEQERELTDNRIAIMLSQLQPHFLYNVLNSIHYLCEVNPPLAQKVTQDFSVYLRANMDSLKKKHPVHFSEELKHIQIYLSLEQMRFSDKLEVSYNLETTDFYLPSLSVQPLIENAIKHGICPKDSIGTVTLSTKEIADYYIITICDDGVGFDINAPFSSERTHVGIENVKTRLQNMCNATLEITSTQGVGTTATIYIPKTK